MQTPPICKSRIKFKLIWKESYKAQWIFSTIFVSLRNIKRSFFESWKWYFTGANWWFSIKTDLFLCFLYHNWSVLMPNHQLAHAKYHFHDSWVMKWTLDVSKRNKSCEKNPLALKLLHWHSQGQVYYPSWPAVSCCYDLGTLHGVEKSFMVSVRIIFLLLLIPPPKESCGSWISETLYHMLICASYTQSHLLSIYFFKMNLTSVLRHHNSYILI